MEFYLISLVYEYPTAHLSMTMNYLIRFPSVSHCLGCGQHLLTIFHISVYFRVP